MASRAVVRSEIILCLVAVVLVVFFQTTEGFNSKVCDIDNDCGDNFRESNCEYDIRSAAGVTDAKRKLTGFLLRNKKQGMRSINKWRTNITRTAVALFLSDPHFFALGNNTGEELAYELSLELLSEIALKKRIPTLDLALFVNALTVACINPRDFYGIDMVDELRQRVNNNSHINPFAILTLCNAKDAITTDVILKLQNQIDTHLRPLRTDTQAMILMVLSCMQSKSGIELKKSTLNGLISELKKKQQKNGSVGNLKTTALVVQALLAVRDCRAEFDLNSALKFILQKLNEQSFLSTRDIFYILPILSKKSLVHIDSDHCIYPVKTDREVINGLREYPNERIQVQISVFIGNDKNISRTWKVKVPSDYSLYQVLENIGTLEPSYKVQYSFSDGKPYVDSLASFQDDTIEGSFWFIYTKPLSSNENPTLIEESPVDIQLNESEEMILWYRSGFWANTVQEPEVTTVDTTNQDAS